MYQHNGMRPQDIAVLLKLIIVKPGWMNKTIADDLYLSPSEISYSLQRSAQAELVNPERKKVMRKTFLEFIQYGLPRVFPAIRGPIVVGVPTAYSTPIIAEKLMTNELTERIVWPYAEGSARGESISPLYPNAVKAALKDPEMYQLLSLVDVMRLGRIREKEIALKLLSEKFGLHNA